MTQPITLVSHALCPYVQRVAIALAEKSVAHDRVTVDLADKSAWFLEISPLADSPSSHDDGATTQRAEAEVSGGFQISDALKFG